MPHVYATLNMEWVGSQGNDVRDLETLASRGATVIGVQEAKIAHLRGFVKRNPEWALSYVDKPEFRVVSVLYRKDLYSAKYEHVGVPIGFLGTAGAGEDSIKQKIVSAPLLTVRAGADAGKTFRVVNTHLVASAWRPWPASSAEGWRRRAAWAKQMAAFNKIATAGGPSLGGGDLNGLKDKVEPYARNGWSWKSYTGKSHKLGQIDRLGSAGGLRLGTVRVVSMAGSDHNALMAEFTLPAVKPTPPKEPEVARSQNGYPANQRGLVSSRLVPGTRRKLTLRKGAAGDLLLHWAGWFDRNIEDIEGGILDDWGYAERPIRGSSTTLSNHASGTAIDLNAPKHALGRRGTFTKAQVAKMRAELAKYDGCIRWGGDYKNRADEMHFEIMKDEATCARVLKALRGEEKVYALGKRILREGRSGNDVATVQRFLGIEADGIFGPKTKAAVLRYQKQQGLPETGDVWTRTWGLILGALEPKK